MKPKKKKESVNSLSKLKISTLRAKAIRKGIKGTSKMTKAQLIKSLKPTKLSCTIAGKQMHSKKKIVRRKSASKLPRC